MSSSKCGEIDNVLFMGCKNRNSRCQLQMLASSTRPPSSMFVQNSLYLAVNKFASGPTTVNPEDAIEIDPNTAGMSPDEIASYMSNVGGGLCGYPEVLKSAVGLGSTLVYFWSD